MHMAPTRDHTQRRQGEPRRVDVQKDVSQRYEHLRAASGPWRVAVPDDAGHWAGISVAGGTVMPCPAVPSRWHSATS